MWEDGEQIEHRGHNPMTLDPQTCTCGFTKSQMKAEATAGNSHNPDGSQSQLVNLLQKLLHNQQDEESPEFKANRGASTYLNQAQLIIVDPLNKFNNIGKSSYNFAAVQDELKHVYYRLNDEMVKFVKYASTRNQMGAQTQ